MMIDSESCPMTTPPPKFIVLFVKGVAKPTEP